MADKRGAAKINPLLEDVLRRDKTATQGQQTKRWLEDLAAERQAKIGESTGLGDLLTFMPAAGAAKALSAGSKGLAGLNALAFSSQFGEGPVADRLNELMAVAPFFPVFGVGSTKGLAAAQKMLARKPGAELPLFKGEGKLSPKRFDALVEHMRPWVNESAFSESTGKKAVEFRKWLELHKGRGRPIDRAELLDRMPASLRSPFYQSLKEMGYGGIDMPRRSEALMTPIGTKMSAGQKLASFERQGKPTSGGMVASEPVAPAGPRRWPEIMTREQQGINPEWWEKEFKRQTAINEARKQWGMDTLAGSAMSLGGLGSQGRPDEQQSVVPSARKMIRQQLLQDLAQKGVRGPKTPYHDFIQKQQQLIAGTKFAQPYQTKFAEEGILPVVRAAQQLKPPSDRRLGAFYNVATPRTLDPSQNHWFKKTTFGTGGNNLFRGEFSPRNPYWRDDNFGTPEKTAAELIGSDAYSRLEDATSNYRPSKDVLKELGKYGINKKEANHIWSAKEGQWARMDAVTAKVLSNAGYDALVETRPMAMKTKPFTLGQTPKRVGQILSPELFKFREPRFNFSYDRFEGVPRGLDKLRVVQSGNGGAVPQIDPKEFASGRSPELGGLNDWMQRRSQQAAPTPKMAEPQQYAGLSPTPEWDSFYQTKLKPMIKSANKADSWIDFVQSKAYDPNSTATKEAGDIVSKYRHSGGNASDAVKELLQLDLPKPAIDQWVKSLAEMPMNTKMAGLAAGIGGGALSQMNAGQEQQDGENRAGLGLNWRNFAALKQERDRILRKMNIENPSSKQINEIESFIAAKYPKIYERGTRTPVDYYFHNSNLINGGFSPFDNSILLKVPVFNDPMWNRMGRGPVANMSYKTSGKSHLAEALAHEFVHATDFSRMMSGLRDPKTKRPLSFGDFTPLGYDTQGVRENFMKTPGVRNENVLKAWQTPTEPGRYAPFIGRNWKEYVNNAVERRAFPGGKTGANAYKKFTKMEEIFEKAKKKQSIDDLTEYFKKTSLGAGGAALAGSVLPSDDEESKAGLVLNARNMPRLIAMQQSIQRELEKLRPGQKRMNYLESIYAAKYPRLYSNAITGAGKIPHAVEYGAGNGAFSPLSGEVVVGVPHSEEAWKQAYYMGKSPSRRIANTIGHEFMHANDFQRIGKINDPATGRKLDLGDFLTADWNKSPEKEEKMIRQFGKYYPNAAETVKNTQGRYVMPSEGWESPEIADMLDETYMRQPIERRAMRAGNTAETATEKFLKLWKDINGPKKKLGQLP